MINPWIQTGSGIAFDLICPTREMVNFKVDVAESLARIARFIGHVRSGTYSVAQHCVMGADEIYRETGNKELAAAFLLHDAHEAYMGDIATPITAALVYWAGRMATSEIQFIGLGENARRTGAERALSNAINAMKARLDEAIYTAAGIPYPLSEETHAAIKQMDIRMLATERRHLLGASRLPWPQAVEEAKPIRLIGKFTIWPWPDAADEYIQRLEHYTPAFQKPSQKRKAG